MLGSKTVSYANMFDHLHLAAPDPMEAVRGKNP